jgi:uncharacterized protein YceK
MKRIMIALAVGAVVLTGCSSISEDASQAKAKAQASQAADSQAKAAATAKAAAVKAKTVAAAKAAAVAKAKGKAIAKAKAVSKAKARAAERERVARAEASAAKRAKARAFVHDFTSCVNAYGSSSAKCDKYYASGSHKKPNKPNCPVDQGPISGNWCLHSANGPDNPGYVKQCEIPGVPKYQWPAAVNGKC